MTPDEIDNAPLGSFQGIRCPLCLFKLTYRTTRERDQKLGFWKMHKFENIHGELHILTCPGCSTLGPEPVLELYQKYITENVNYH